MLDRGGLRLGKDQEQARKAAVAKANAWTAGQGARLNTSPEAILEAIRRGPWLSEQIEKVRSKYALEGNPPELVGVEPWVDAAIEKRAKAQARAKGDTAMAAAYRSAVVEGDRKAKRRAA